MKPIDADAMVTVMLYDDEHEEYYTERMTVEECLNLYTEEGCPNPVDRPQGDSVSRRYLLAEIDDLADEFSEVDENGLHSERWCGILDSKGIIVNAPSVSDRPHGHYIKGRNGEWYCSECKRIDDKYSVARFCWHCGARMKGADNE